MNHIFLYIGAGGAVVTILLFWALRSKKPVALSKVNPETQLLDALEIRPQMMAYQIFDEADWKYVCESAPVEERAMFLKDRTRIALLWLDEMRGQAAQVMWLHRLASRQAKNLSATLEIEIAANYGALLLCCMLMRVAIRAHGPFGARIMMDRLLGCSRRLWQESEDLLTSLGVPRRVELTIVEK